MLRSTHILLSISLLTMVASCSPVSIQNLDPEPRFEARAWLESNPNPYAFAGNRFASTEEALAFVNTLYEAGALKVYVTGIYDEKWRIDAEGGPYADTLIVRLPSDTESRKILFEISNEEAVSEGFLPEKDTGQEELLLWWD